MASTYLITGGAGFIGSHLTISLAQLGERVRVLDNFTSTSRRQFEELVEPYRRGIEIIEGDIRNLDDCERATSGADYVLHHAAMASVQASISHPDQCISTNVAGTTNLLMAAAKSESCKRLVFASSSAVYGDANPAVKVEDALLDPLTPYATSKLTGELLCRNFYLIKGLPTVCLRYFNVYGPRQDPNGPYAAVIPKFIDCIHNGTPLNIYGDGEQSRDFITVGDVVLANQLACSTSADNVAGKSFNIGSGKRTTLNQVVEAFSLSVGHEIDVNYLPKRNGDILHSLADVTRASTQLNFNSTTPLAEGLRGLISGP